MDINFTQHNGYVVLLSWSLLEDAHGENANIVGEGMLNGAWFVNVIKG